MANTSIAGVNYADGFKLTQVGGAAADSSGDLPGEASYSVETTRGVVAAGTGQRSLVGFVSPRIRVFQPAGTPLWSIQEAERDTDDFLKRKKAVGLILQILQQAHRIQCFHCILERVKKKS